MAMGQNEHPWGPRCCCRFPFAGVVFLVDSSEILPPSNGSGAGLSAAQGLGALRLRRFVLGNPEGRMSLGCGQPAVCFLNSFKHVSTSLGLFNIS